VPQPVLALGTPSPRIGPILGTEDSIADWESAGADTTAAVTSGNGTATFAAADGFAAIRAVKGQTDHPIQAGDVMIWGSGYGQFGHIAIVTEATVDSFKALSQNDPINRETHIKSYNYNNTLGWLSPKGTMSDLHTYLGVTTDAEAKNKLKEHLGEANSKCNWGLTGDQGGYLGSERKKNNELTALNVSHITEIEAQKAKIAELEQELADCEAEAPENDVR
jgi:hypothetical protein